MVGRADLVVLPAEDEQYHANKRTVDEVKATPLSDPSISKLHNPKTRTLENLFLQIHPTTHDLILSPPIATSHTLIETGHGLVRTSNLDLEKRRLVAIAPIIGALHTALLRIVPGAGPAKDVLLLDALVDAAREDGLGDVVLKGACSAFEAVLTGWGEGDGEDVGAVRADWCMVNN